MTVIESADVAVEEPKPRRRPPKRRPGAWRRGLRRDWPLYSLAVAPLIFLAIFRYVPMAGNIIAFRRFHPGGSIFISTWSVPTPSPPKVLPPRKTKLQQR